MIIIISITTSRVLLRKFIGERILSLLEQQYSIQSPSSNIRRSLESAGSNKREVNLLYAKNIGLLAAGLVSILGVFKSTGLIADFKFDVDDLVDEEYAFSSFEDVRIYLYNPLFSAQVATKLLFTNCHYCYYYYFYSFFLLSPLQLLRATVTALAAATITTTTYYYHHHYN
jgi:hypothetical protein